MRRRRTMCEMCRAIKMGATEREALDQYLASMRDTIDMYGVALTGVVDGDPPFVYTVGRTARDLPELLITGVDMARGAAMMNDAFDLADDVIAPGARLPLLDPAELTMGVIEIDPEDAEMNTALALYGHGHVKALQLVWPDQENRLPGEPGYSSEFPQPTYPIGAATVEITTPACTVCGRTSRITMPRAAHHRWALGDFIQDAWPDSKPEEREMLMTGTHPDCWDQLVPPDEEDLTF
jgi:hypothetical protein